MHSSSLELGRKRVELNVCESFKYFPQGLLREYLKKKKIVISNFTMKGASVTSMLMLMLLNDNEQIKKRLFSQLILDC